MDLSLQLGGPMFWAPWHQSIFIYFHPSNLLFPVPPGREMGTWGMGVQT